MKAIALVALLAAAAQAGPAKVGPGIYRPAFPASPAEREIRVSAFWLDREPVTNAEFAAFVRAKPEWARDRIKRIYADDGYLSAPGGDHAPVVRVSWFAARAYCGWRGGRLPRESEWELAAASNDGAEDLAWYEKPTPAVLPDVGGAPNPWGVRDLHGLVWEWIEDFTGSLAATGSQVCGAEAVAAKDPRAYAAFMRFAFRSSLTARDTVSSLGFRCAYDREMTR